jgi:hypothetical protein
MRIGGSFVLALLVGFHLVGCQSFRGPARPPVLIPAAPLDDTPRPKAEAAPRGNTGLLVSTAADAPKRLNGQEESSYEDHIPPGPMDIPAPPTGDLMPPPPPVTPFNPSPPSLPPVPTAPPVDTPLVPSTSSAPSAPGSPQPASPQALTSDEITKGLSAFSNSNAQGSDSTRVRPLSISGVREVKFTPGVEVVANQIAPTPASDAGTDELGKFRALYERANRRVASMDTYTLRMRRREVVGGKARPEELILASFRREPFSIYLKWLGDEGKGREVCFVQGQHDSLVHTLLAPGDLFGFGRTHFKCAPDNPLVKSNCRYPITDAGFAPMMSRFGRLLTALGKGDGREGTAKYVGEVKRPEFDEPLDAVVQSLPPNHEGLFPSGGQRTWHFDRVDGLPVLVITIDHRGQEVEYYCHDRIQAPANLGDDDFNPYKLWKNAAK